MNHDPIHYQATTVQEDDGTSSAPGWYYYDETWAHRYGPFDTSEEAAASLRNYLETQLG